MFQSLLFWFSYRLGVGGCGGGGGCWGDEVSAGDEVVVGWVRGGCGEIKSIFVFLGFDLVNFRVCDFEMDQFMV